MSTLREALEEALVENPDDLAAHMAYADLLHDQGDPRGELIQVQLAMEAGALDFEKRQQFQRREAELLVLTRTACLGRPLAALLQKRGNSDVRVSIERGWLASFEKEKLLGEDLAEALADAPEARLLRRLVVASLPSEAASRAAGRIPNELVRILTEVDTFCNLRVLYLNTADGFLSHQDEPVDHPAIWTLFTAGAEVWDWIATMPRLEELSFACRTRETHRLFALPNLGRLRRLQLNLSEEYPLAVLAGNPVLTNLTHLALHPLRGEYSEVRGPLLRAAHLAELANSVNLPALTHLRFQMSDAGDEGVRVALASGLLRRLRFLDLALGTITDAGANLLAGADFGDLEVLDLSRNTLTRQGQRALSRISKPALTLRMAGQTNGEPPDWLYPDEDETVWSEDNTE